jgi:uncharacterized protein YbaR (Trm112 family)
LYIGKSYIYKRRTPPVAIRESLLEVLACPACKTRVELVKEHWLVCSKCHRKYPIKDEIPIMLIEEGDKHKNTPVEKLPQSSS